MAGNRGGGGVYVVVWGSLISLCGVLGSYVGFLLSRGGLHGSYIVVP
jgi:hypothetical protein